MKWNWNEGKKIDASKILVEHYIAEFITVDGKKHYDAHFPFVAPDFIRYSVPEYLMIGVKYLQEDDNTFFPIENIISIKWNKDATLYVTKKDLNLAYYYG